MNPVVTPRSRDDRLGGLLVDHGRPGRSVPRHDGLFRAVRDIPDPRPARPPRGRQHAGEVRGRNQLDEHRL